MPNAALYDTSIFRVFCLVTLLFQLETFQIHEEIFSMGRFYIAYSL